MTTKSSVTRCCRLLEQCGFRATVAVSGREALAAVNKKPDVVLLDLNLPDLNGFQVCRLLRADPNTAEVPVVIYSSCSQGGSAVEQARQSVFRFSFFQ